MKGRAILISVLALGLMLALAVGLTQAQEPGPQGEVGVKAAPVGATFTYQGRLTDGGGPANGSYDFQFKLYDAAGGGVWVGTIPKDDVTVTDGLFTVELGFGSAFTGDARWLEIGVRPGASAGAYTTLMPRQALTATPYALYALGAPWSGLAGIPPDFADGVDDDTLGGLSCSNGQVAKWNSATSQWQCSNDETSAGGGGWSLTGNVGTNPATNFLGTTDTQALELRVNSARALRLEPNAYSPNLIGGSSSNSVTSGVAGATIGGGGAADDGWGNLVPNRVTDDYGTVGGGGNNQAGDNAGATDDASYSTVAGGLGNTASGATGFNGGAATVGGGYWNTASGGGATIAGGVWNIASGNEATISGGLENAVSGEQATVGGGGGNTANGDHATVGGGFLNHADALTVTIGGGEYISVTGRAATVAGGSWITVTGDYAAVGGGGHNTASGGGATIGGGGGNTASGRAATIGGGEGNTASGDDATVGGGWGNTASGDAATIGGGADNMVTAILATVGGGYGNTASGWAATVAGGEYISVTGQAATVAGGSHITVTRDYATVGGGGYNTASGIGAVVAGGGGEDPIVARLLPNTASGNLSVISGGGLNTASSGYATISGGEENTASGWAATIGGGSHITVAGNWATIGGGEFNTASGYDATVGGGNWNEASGEGATVGGGDSNTADGGRATVGGGSVNTASGWAATVPGGYGNTAQGHYSFAAGYRAKANHDGTFVWADSTGADFASTAANQFAVRANGGALVTGASGEPMLTVTNLGGNDGLRVNKSGDDGLQIGDGTNFPNYGVYIPSDGVSFIALYVQTADANGEWALSTLDKISAANVTFSSLTLVAVADGPDSLAPGDLVAATGLADPLPDTLSPLPRVRLADAKTWPGVIGVVEGRLALQSLPGKADEDGHAPLELHSVPGPAKAGDYVALTVLGVAHVKADATAGAIVAGQRLTAADQSGHVRALRTRMLEGMVVTEGAPVIGIALAPLDEGSGTIPVLVTLQ